MALPLAGARIRAADLAAIFPLGVDAWTPYAATLTQSVTITKTGTSDYTRAGRWITVRFALGLTGAGTANNPIQLSLPVPAKAGGSLDAIGTFVYFDSGSSVQSGVCVIGASTSVIRFRAQGVQQSPVLGETGGSVPIAVTAASGDYLGGSVTYESAS